MLHASKTAFLSVLSNTFVVMLKVIVGFLTGSVAILSEAIHSLLDLIASIITFFSVRIASKPADAEHPYGHGKVEHVSGTIETLLVFVAGIWIIYECLHKFTTPVPLKLPLLGILVMVLGAIINAIVSKIVYKKALETESVAMKANALHLQTDVYTSIGVAISLLVVHLTGWLWLDPLIGMVLACFIMKEAYHLMKEAFPPLLDTRLSETEERTIRQAIEVFQTEYIEYHDFRTRRSGATISIDFHLVVASTKDIQSAHALCDQIEAEIRLHVQNASILIHLEPEEEKRL